MTKKNYNTAYNREEIKMVKYIVEAPEPKNGQKASSGGIRENGKLASQFKNPVPYKEPTLPPTVINQTSNTGLVFKEQARKPGNEAGMYLIGIFWQEVGEPLLRLGLHKLGSVIISKIEAPTNRIVQHISSSESEIIDVEADEIETLYDDDKIIRFHNGKAI